MKNTLVSIGLLVFISVCYVTAVDNDFEVFEDMEDVEHNIKKRQAPGMAALALGYDRMNDNFQNLLKVGVMRTPMGCGMAVVGAEIEPCDCLKSFGVPHGKMSMMLHCVVTGGGVPQMMRGPGNTCAPGQYCCCDLRDMRLGGRRRGLAGLAGMGG